MDPPACFTMSGSSESIDVETSAARRRRARTVKTSSCTTPTGSTELWQSLQASSSTSTRDESSVASSGYNTSDQENKDIVDASAESLALSSIHLNENASGGLDHPSKNDDMHCLLRRGGKAKSSPRNEEPEGQASTPLMENSEQTNHPNHHRTTPLLQLPLPPEKSPRKNSSGGGSSSATNNSISTSTPPSSIKNAILARKAQRYSSLKKRKGPNNILNRLFCNNGLETMASGDEDLPDDVDLEAQLPAAPSDENAAAFSPPASTSCVHIGCDIIQQTCSESLTLHDESIVRRTIQTNLDDMAAPSPSHKTFAQLKQAFEEMPKTSSTKTRFPAVSTVRDDDSTSIATPRMKISMVTDDLDDLASASSSQVKPISAVAGSPKKTKKKKGSGGLVMPSQFRHQSTKESGKATSTVLPSSPKHSSSRSRSPVKKESKKSPMGMSLTMSTVSTAETSTTSGSDHVSIPPEMVRITSSLEDLSTVPEVSTSRETATKSVDEYELSKQTLSLSFSKLSPSSSRDALARAQSELREEFQEDGEELATTKSNRSMGSATSTSTKSNDEKLKYDTAINSLKDQVALANRLAKLRLDEIQRLESTMDEMRENQEQADIIRDLNHQLREIKAQKDKDLDDMKQTMERRIDEIRKEMETRESASSRSTGKSSPERVVQVQQEIDQAKARLEEKALDVELERQLHQLTDELSNVKRELDKKSRELSDIRKENEELQSVSSSRSMSESEELLRVKEELADLTEKLAITSQSLSNTSGGSRTHAEEQNQRHLLDGSHSGRPPMAGSRSITRSRSLSPNARFRQLGSNNVRLQQEKERLTEENAKLSKKLDARLKLENDVNQKELELLRNEVLRLQTENDKATKQLSACSKDLDELRRKAEDDDSEMTNARKEKQALAERLSDMTKEHQTETTALKSENAKLREALDEYCAVEEAMQITSNEQELLREKLQEAKAKLDEADSIREREISILRSEHDERIKTLKSDLQRVKSGAAAEIAQVEHDKQQTIARLNEEHKNDISRLKEQAFAQNDTSALEERLFECQKHLEESRAEISRLNKAVQESEQASKREIDAIQEKLLEVIQQNEQLCQQNSHFNDKMKAAEESHNKQFEELLGQLDLVEADHIETIGQRNMVIADKEAAISTLSSQLADALNKVKELGQNVTDEQNARKSVEQRCQESATLVKSQRKEITVLKQTHETFVAQAAKLQEEACQEARDEMIRKAESQFQQANQHYIKLRKQFEESQLKVKRLETQSRVAKKASDELLMEKETVEADLKAQVATLLAAKAKLEADNARRVKDHRRELEDSLQCVADLEERIEAAESGRQVLIDQRDKAVRDFEDMKGFSEELMTLLEAGKDGGGQ